MAYLQISGLKLAFGNRDIINDVTISMADGSRIALAGPNGTGKTTLMRILAGVQEPDRIERSSTKNIRISYLPQMLSFSQIAGAGQAEKITVYSAAEEAYRFVFDLLKREDAIGDELKKSTTMDTTTAALLEEQAHIHETVQDSGYYEREETISSVLRGLGFSPHELSKAVKEFSGGWQMRVALAKILLENPDVMLLDEPTNYLDIEARTWLTEFLSKFKGAVLIVSHDRYFLDATVKEVAELFNGKLSRYPGNYTNYEKKRALELDSIFKAWEAQQEEIAHHEDFIRRFRYKASKASLVQSRIKQLEKIIPIVIPEGMKKIHFRFPPAPHSGVKVLTLDGVGKSYGAHRVLENVNWELERGTKLALVGVNGAGKSTLMRILADRDKEHEGTVKFGSGVSVSYFAQDSAESLSGTDTVEDTLLANCPFELVPKVRNLLGAFLFRGDDVHKELNMLSGGERSRLALLMMLLKPSNLLILDEPTNHLDLTSKDILLEALKKFEGSVIFVSHDRGFIEELAEQVLELRAGEPARLFVGDYQYYLEKKASLAEAGLDIVNNTVKSSENRDEPVNKKVPIIDKNLRSEIRKLERREEEILKRLESITAQKKSCEDALGNPANYSQGELMRKFKTSLDELSAEETSLTSDWEAITDQIEKLRAQAK